MKKILLIKKRIGSMLILTLFWGLILLSESPFVSMDAGRSAVAVNVLIGCLIICSYIAALLINNSFQHNFLLVALFIGVFYVVIRPFTCPTDEEYHFLRAYDLSFGHFFPSEAGGYVPAGYSTYAITNKWNIKTIFDESIWFAPVDSSEFIPRIRSASYLFFEYIPGAFGVGIARLFRLPLIGVVLFGRLSYYFSYVAICYLAIKRTETLRSLFFLLALCGGFIMYCGVIQPDLLLVPFSFLFVSICIHYCFDKAQKDEISTFDTVLLAVSAFMISSFKYCGYAFLLLFAFFIPSAKYKNRNKVLMIVIICFIVAAFIQLFALIKYRGSLGGVPHADVDMSRQIYYLFGKPINAVRVLGGDIIWKLYDRIFFQGDFSISAIDSFTYVYALFPVLGALLEKNRPAADMIYKPKRFVFACFLLAFIMQIIICFSLYINWTPVGKPTIYGDMPRYTLPFLSLCLIPFSMLPIKNELKDWPETLALCALLAQINTMIGLISSF